jgi:hypothetical protein
VHALSLFSLLCLHQSSGNGFQCQTFPNYPMPQLPASNSNSSQRLNCNGPLTNRLLTNSLQSTVLAVRIGITLWLAVYFQSVCLGVKSLESHDQYSFFRLNTCGYSPYVTASLMRGWVRSLQLLLAPASPVILRHKYRRTHGHILLSQIQDSPNLEGQVPIFISPRNRVAVIL